MSQILVTGGGGYIGSVLVKSLLNEGHSIRCLDRFFFGEETLSDLIGNKRLTTIRDDIRWFDPNVLKNVDVVMDLAAISNDPSGELDPSKTFDINYLGRSRVARLSKEYGVKRYILASSCSVYGFQEGVLDETSDLDPRTTYAKAGLRAEGDVIPLSSSNFVVTVLRFATVYGYSRRMRFDLAVNAMVLSLFKNSKIPVMRDGKQWRPFIHIRDVINAYKVVMTTSEGKVGGEIFNIGSNGQNYQILELAELVARSLNRNCGIEWYGSPDYRSYKVSFDKIKNETGFEVFFTPDHAAKEIYQALMNGNLKETLQTRTVEWYKHLIECHKISTEISLRNTIL